MAGFWGTNFILLEKSHAGGLRTDPPLDADGLQKLIHFGTGILVPVKAVVKKILT